MLPWEGRWWLTTGWFESVVLRPRATAGLHSPLSRIRSLCATGSPEQSRRDLTYWSMLAPDPSRGPAFCFCIWSALQEFVGLALAHLGGLSSCLTKTLWSPNAPLSSRRSVPLRLCQGRDSSS